MKKSYKSVLLQSAVAATVAAGGVVGGLVHSAQAKDGFYLRPEAEIIFVDKKFTKGVTSVGVGGGGNLAFGYEIKNFQIEATAGGSYYGGKGTVTQTGATQGFPLTLKTTVDSKEGFVPITVGLNYAIPVGSSLNITPGIAGGVWVHTVDRSYTAVNSLTGTTTTGTDKATETKGVVVPSIGLDYRATNNFAVTFRSKFYIVPSGYSDNYTTANRTAAKAAVGLLGLTPAYTTEDDLFWYGSIAVGAQYAF